MSSWMDKELLQVHKDFGYFENEVGSCMQPYSRKIKTKAEELEEHNQFIARIDERNRKEEEHLKHLSDYELRQNLVTALNDLWGVRESHIFFNIGIRFVNFLKEEVETEFERYGVKAKMKRNREKNKYGESTYTLYYIKLNKSAVKENELSYYNFVDNYNHDGYEDYLRF